MRGIDLHRVTLHVGPGTFLPVKADDTSGHKMHPEWGSVSAETAAALNATRRAGGRIVAVGSTSLRLLESAAAEDGTLAPFSGETALFITPGYRFRAVDAMLTNFHLPRSTLFMLVSAFSGLDAMRRAYAHAIASGYRFYSYGDACLLFRCTMSRDAEPFSFRLIATDGAARSGEIATAHGVVRTPAFMPVGTQARDQRRASRRRARVRRRYHARQHLSPDAAAGRRTRRRARRLARIHALALSDPHRFRRLSGDVACRRCAKSRRRA